MRLIQGDSYGHDYRSPDIASFTGFAATWVFQQSIGGETIASGTLTMSDDTTKFELRLSPSDTAKFPVGKGYITVQITSLDGAYSQEIQQKVRVKPQAIPSEVPPVAAVYDSKTGVLTLSVPDQDATIYYTTDGSDPVIP